MNLGQRSQHVHTYLQASGVSPTDLRDPRGALYSEISKTIVFTICDPPEAIVLLVLYKSPKKDFNR